MKKGNVKSIRAVLKNISDKERIDFQLIVIRYLHERFLYRVSVSAYAKHFFLKGGNLLYAIKGLHIRPTVDIDMLAMQLSNDKEQLHRIFRTICSIEYSDDCVIFNVDSIKTEDIAADAKYSGVRILIDAGLDTIRQQLQIDIGFSDVITPAPVSLTDPTLLGELAQPFQIGAYSIETVVAEKFHAMIALGIFNSRMKDFYDVYLLLQNNNINDVILQEAIRRTFQQRNTTFDGKPEVFTASFAENKYRREMWNAFIRKMRITDNLDFPVIVRSIAERLEPIYNTFK
jgi:hypothetical protein